jgi:uncharacterized protein (TIGR02118 family)
MTAKLVALYREPENREAFEQKYFETHVPLVEKMPGLRGMEIMRFEKNLMGKELPYYMMATLTFESQDALNAAMGSPEGQAAGANIMGFAGSIITLLAADVIETPVSAR